MTTTTKTIDERIAHIQSRIDDMHRAIGSAYVAGDQDSISYYQMHLKAWQDELAELEVEREANHPTLEERCKELLSKSSMRHYILYNRQKRNEEKYGKDSKRAVTARDYADKSWLEYDAQLSFAAELLDMDYCDLADAVRDAGEWND